ncbi:PD-(D/E)XK nuclease family protein [Hankyongella ginsenosidimutans]|uniref:PD-(D/E)XK nuclease family protein n=1 Tax=Hankyongella ginsenosidimutans TaxID=1763828 RepID=UPI001CA3102E|nr:PD-(D/E)XK nuclease family protein [Hankyongella ginsenosidimutans]
MPSRFWLRLAAAAGGALPTDDRLLALARALDQPERVTPAEPPLPCPPRAMRPQVISVTQVEKLATDPYAFYAAKILKLQELEPVDADPNPAQRGTAIHKAFELWLNNHPPALWIAQTLEALLQGNCAHSAQSRCIWRCSAHASSASPHSRQRRCAASRICGPRAASRRAGRPRSTA